MIQSVYSEGDRFRERRFLFKLSAEGVEHPTLKDVESGSHRTVVTLNGFREGFRKESPKTLNTIARHIVEHCLEYFALPSCPRVTVGEDDQSDSIDVNRLFREMRISSESTEFTVSRVPFHMVHLAIAVRKKESQHRVYFCAHKRTVRFEKLAGRIPNLPPVLKDETGKAVVYAGYVSGVFLDERVNAERTSFQVLDGSQPLLESPDEPTWPEILRATLSEAEEYLLPYTEPAKKEKETQIARFVHERAPQYRPLLRHRSEALDQIAPGLPEEKLDLELHKLDQAYDAELREKYYRLLEAGEKEAQTLEEQKERLEAFLEEWNEAGMAKLARYVAHRKATLAFIEDSLRSDPGGNPALEERLHQVVFPLRKTSQDVRPEQMNLWIIDEKLAFHHYLASDKRVSQLKEVVDSDSQKRPDLLIFDRPFAFADTERPFRAIVLIEFKRPARDDYTEDDNPITQVYTYVDVLREGKATDLQGRFLKVGQNVPFYAFIVCDLTASLVRRARDYQLTLTPDESGYFGFHAERRLYLEIASYDKLVRDAKRRNAILFEKLGIGVSAAQ
ncbi:hypothetical protein ACFL59_14685 [Planctomycetota bacterium]